MGENKYINELDAFTKKYVKDISNEKVSADFTTSIMQQISKEESFKAIKYKALITKKMWFVIAVVFLGIILFPYKETSNTFLKLPEVDLSFLSKFQMPNIFDSVTDSNTVFLSIFLFGLLFIGQVIFLKNHFNKRLH